MDEFLLRALLGGAGVAILSGPLGCLVVWRKMAYFGATLSHAALLGIALGLLFKINFQLSILLVCMGVSLLLMALGRRQHLGNDTVLGILAHGSLAAGLVVLAFIPGMRTDLVTYLIGDILSISWTDVAWIYTGGLVVLLALSRIWRPLLSLIVHRDLARVDGINESRIHLVFFILISAVVALAMQVVGVLLIVSLLIIPAATARPFSSSPERMALLAALIGAFSVSGGLAVSLAWDSPAGPAIVLASSLLFALSLLFDSRQ